MAFWVMWFFGVKWVRRTVLFLGVVILFLGMCSIYLSIESRDSDALKLTGISKDIYLSITFMTSSMFVLGVLWFVDAWKNPRIWRFLFTFGSLVLWAMYSYYGIKLKIITSKYITSFDTEEWRMLDQYQYQAALDHSVDDSKPASYTIKDSNIKLFNDLYLMGRSSYWKKSPTGWPWKTSPINQTNVYHTFVYNNSDSSVVVNVQGCSDKILGSYENYGISLNLDEYKSLFNYLGKYEQAYKCAGFCAYETAYYFYDISQGPPTKSWDNMFKEQIINNDIDIFANDLIIISAILSIWWFIHFGLFKKESKSDQIVPLHVPAHHQSVTMASRIEDESRISKF